MVSDCSIAIKKLSLIALVWSTFVLFLFSFDKLTLQKSILTTSQMQTQVSASLRKPCPNIVNSMIKSTMEIPNNGAQSEQKPDATAVINPNQYSSSIITNCTEIERQEWKPRTVSSDNDLTQKRCMIKEMMKHAWNNYVKYAWGFNELRPVSKTAHSPYFMGNSPLGLTIVDALDTLYIMDLKDEFKSGRDWVQNNVNWDSIKDSVSVFEVNIRFVGGLLSAYALTKDSMFLKKAEHIAMKILPAFHTKTGLPMSTIWLNKKYQISRLWQSPMITNLAEVGSLHLEFVYLSEKTLNPIFKEKVNRIRDVLQRARPDNGLYPNFIDITTGVWAINQISLGACGDSFYEYLLKAWIQSKRKDSQAKEMFFDAVRTVNKHLLHRSGEGLLYLAEMKYKRLIHEMSHLACFAGGLFALASQETNKEESKKFLHIAEELANTCHESYIRTATRLGPESFGFDVTNEAASPNPRSSDYILRPEVVETYFYLWRITKDQKYRDWAWDVVMALQKHCRVEGGFSGITNVYITDSNNDDVQQSFFLSETLKYLYLIFDDNLLPLDQWVFNTEAHPLPIL